MMTREEARKQLEELFEYCENMKIDGEIQTWERDCEAIEMAISALRPVSREQVEKVWRGEFIHDRPRFNGGVDWYHCSRCGALESGVNVQMPFCGRCGSAMTDEAVDMVMERLEALQSDEC